MMELEVRVLESSSIHSSCTAEEVGRLVETVILQDELLKNLRKRNKQLEELLDKASTIIARGHDLDSALWQAQLAKFKQQENQDGNKY